MYTQQELSSAVSYSYSNATGLSGVALNETFVEMKRELVYRNQANFLGKVLLFTYVNRYFICTFKCKMLINSVVI